MRQETMGFWDAVASAGPYANNRSRQITTPTLHHSIFTGFALDIVGYSHGIFISHIDVVMCDRPSVL